MAEFTVVRQYKVQVEDGELAKVPMEQQMAFIDACTRQLDVGDGKPLYLSNEEDGSYWGDFNDVGDNPQLGPIKWWGEETDSDVD